MITLLSNLTSEPRGTASVSAVRLSEIGRQTALREIEAAWAEGLPVTGVRGGWVLRLWSDGREERLAPAPD